MLKLSSNQITKSNALHSYPINLTALNRDLRLDVINGFLISQGLLPLSRLGDANNGELEFTGINSFWADPFVSRIDFQTKCLNREFNHLCFLSPASDGCSGTIVVPVVNNQYLLLVEQFRPTVGVRTLEVPRGFINPEESNRINNSFGNALREFSEETGLDQTKIAYFPNLVGEVFENSGVSTNKNKVYRVAITVPEEQLNNLIKTNHLDQGEVDQFVSTRLVEFKDLKLVIKDQHSASAIWLALN